MGKKRKICECAPKMRLASFHQLAKARRQRPATARIQLALGPPASLFGKKAEKSLTTSQISCLLEILCAEGCPPRPGCVQIKSCALRLDGKVPQPA
jgi:hypothetical protein